MRVVVVDYGSGNLTSAARAIAPRCRDRGDCRHSRGDRRRRCRGRRGPRRAAGARRVRRLRRRAGGRGRRAGRDRTRRGGGAAVPGHLRRHAVDGRARAGAHGDAGFRLGCRRRGGDGGAGPAPAADGLERARLHARHHPLLDGCNPATTPISSTATPCAAPTRRMCSPPPITAAPITAMVAHGNRAGTQFHVEKSQATGLRILANFLRWTP